MTQTHDVTVTNEGSIFIFHLHTDNAVDWIEKNVADPVWFHGNLAVERRYARDLADGMLNDGLSVQ